MSSFLKTQRTILIKNQKICFCIEPMEKGNDEKKCEEKKKKN